MGFDSVRAIFVGLLLCLVGKVGAQPPCTLSLSLAQAEMIALSQNKDILTMTELVQKARQGTLEQKSKWLPKIELISRGYATQEPQFMINSRSTFISQFNTLQRIWDLQAYYDVSIAKLLADQLQLLKDAVIIDTLYAIRRAYYQVVLDYETIATTKANIELFSSLAQKAAADYQIGTAILLTVNQAKVAIANATAAYYQAVKQLKIDKDLLARVLGYDPGSLDIEVEAKEIPIYEVPLLAHKVGHVEQVFARQGYDTLIFNPGYPQTEERLMAGLFSEAEILTWESRALMWRPSLRAKETEVRIAGQQVKQSRGEYAPRLHLEANYGGYPARTFDNTSSHFFNQKMHWALGFELSWDLWDGGGREHRVCQALYERNARNYAYRKSVQMTYEGVRKQIFEIEESEANFVTADASVKLAEQTVELARSQLQIGYINVFDYQIVVDSLIRALNIRNQARFDLIDGYYGLIHASGADLKCGK